VEYTNIKLEIENGVATIRLNRPNALNALNSELLEELSDAISTVDTDEAVKALVVRGEGRAFCSGADLTFFETAFDNPSQLTSYLKKFSGCLFQLEEFLQLKVIVPFSKVPESYKMSKCNLLQIPYNFHISKLDPHFHSLDTEILHIYHLA